MFGAKGLGHDKDKNAVEESRLFGNPWNYNAQAQELTSSTNNLFRNY